MYHILSHNEPIADRMVMKNKRPDSRVVELACRVGQHDEIRSRARPPKQHTRARARGPGRDLQAQRRPSGRVRCVSERYQQRATRFMSAGCRAATPKVWYGLSAHVPHRRGKALRLLATGDSQHLVWTALIRVE